MRRANLILAVLLSLSFSGLSHASPAPVTSPSTSPSASPSATSPSAVPTPVVSFGPSPSPRPLLISPAEASKILKEFTRALRSEAKALAHRQKFDLKELKASQAARLREWESSERKARHRFFAENKVPAERRVYVRDFVARRKALLQMMKDERKARERERDSRLSALKQDQASRLKEFQSYLSRGERPPEQLWPAPGR